jgi:hypothetical protein
MKKLLLLFAVLVGFGSLSMAQTDPAKGMYFKFQGRVKAGMGQTFKAKAHQNSK